MALPKLPKKGFTLIELLVVIAIIGILASFIVASFTSAQQKGRDSKRKTDLDAVKKALELFKGDTTGGAYYPGNSLANLVPSYIKAVPVDPSSAAAYTYAGGGTGCTAANNTLTTANCSTYALTACLENTNDPQKDATDTCAAATTVSYTVTQP